jgi:hypothetical protein
MTARTAYAVFFWLLMLPLAGAPSPAGAADLTLFVEKHEAVFRVRAVSAFDTTEFSIDPQAGFVQKLGQIYDMIERRPEETGALGRVGDFMGKQYQTVRQWIPFWKDDQGDPEVKAKQDVASLERLLDDAGALFFDPIETQVAIARHIEFIVTAECLFYPFDVLHVGGTPLFLKKPISYGFAPKEKTALRASASWRGLIIADAQTDPERGADAVAASFPGAFGFDAENVRSAEIDGISSADFILISAEGSVDGFNLQHLLLRPPALSRLRPELVYFDCNLYGLNLTFLNHFSQSGVPIYVAPIFSRQQGAASAQTMIRFFRALNNGDRPARALYLARKTIYDSVILTKADKLTALRSAFPFRLYWLN